MRKIWFTIGEIAACPGVHESRDTLWRRSNREGWRWGTRGDGKVVYYIDGLPKAIREAVEKHRR